MSEALSKAAGFNTTAKALRRMLGNERFEQLTQTLPADTQALLRRPPPAMQWLPLGHFLALIHGAEACLGGVSHVEELARKAISEDLNTVYRVFIRLATPQYVLTRAANLFSTYNQNNGELVIRQTSVTSVEVAYIGQASDSPAYWAYQKGALWAVVNLLGLRAPAIAPIAPRKNEDAVFRVSWS